MIRFPRREHFRDRHHYALAVASEVAAPVLRLASRALSRGPLTPPQEWRSALIVGHGHIGDVLYQTISLGSLASGLPNCDFDYLTTGIGAEVLAGNPALTNILPWDTGLESAKISKSHMTELRDAHYDAIICTNLVRHQEGLFLGVRLGIPNRVAFTHRGLSGLVTLPVHLPEPVTPAQQSRVMAEAITGIRDESDLRPVVFLTDDDNLQAEVELRRLKILPSELLVACAFTTRQARGRIDSAIFADILRSLRRSNPSVRIVLCGTSADEPLLRVVAKEMSGNVAISAGRMSVRALAAFMQRCDAFFGMDSGPRHLANAMRVPCIFLRNMGVRATEAGAYCSTEVDLATSGSFLDEKQITARLATIDVDDAAATILRAARAKKHGESF